MPARSAAPGPEKRIGVPLRKISPASIRWTPANNFMRVDFPAPFSPVIACTEPARPAKETDESASVEPKRFVRFLKTITERSAAESEELCVGTISRLIRCFSDRDETRLLLTIEKRIRRYVQVIRVNLRVLKNGYPFF